MKCRHCRCRCAADKAEVHQGRAAVAYLEGGHVHDPNFRIIVHHCDDCNGKTPDHSAVEAVQYCPVKGCAWNDQLPRRGRRRRAGSAK